MPMILLNNGVGPNLTKKGLIANKTIVRNTVEIMMDDEKGRAVAYLMPDITS